MMKITGAILERSAAPRPYAASKPIVVSDLELDPPGPGEVLVRIEAAGLCHSDLSVVDGNRPRPLPMLLGHEAAGIVTELGEGVDDLQIGDRVIATFLPRCGECAECLTDGRLPCRVGSAANGEGTLVGDGMRLSRDGSPVNHHLGVSGFATHAVMHRTSLVRVESDVPADVAALLGCAVLTGGGAVINAANLQGDETVIIVGLGGVGMAAALVAKAIGCTVIGVDAIEEKLEQARDLGLDDALTPQAAAEAGLTAAAVIECAGSARAFEGALALTSPGGITVTVGLPAPDARSTLSPLQLTAEARTIAGSYLGSSVPSRDIPRYADLWRAGRLPVEKLVSTQIGLHEINEGMDALAEGKVLRQLIRFD